jgi:dihydroorotate dehydrogenase
VTASQRPPRLYSALFHTVLRRFDPENAHYLAAFVIRVCGLPGIGGLVRRSTAPKNNISVRALGSTFSTPFGLAAGFDKDARYIRGLANLGFGHVEVGTLTALAQPGNPRPRLFRLVADFALINRMGFNNRGAAAAVAHLRKVRSWKHRPVIGVNIGKSRVVEVENAIADYVTSATLVAPLADYVVVNVSSPNTPGLRGLQEIDQLRPLLTAVLEAVGAKPLLVKIAPDLTDDEVRKVSNLAVDLGLAGIIATNTTLSREGLKESAERVEAIGAGGLSGRPLKARAQDILGIIRSVVPADFCVISVGGVETAEDVADRLQLGATLVQGYSAFVYWGPGWVRAINRGLS